MAKKKTEPGETAKPESKPKSKPTAKKPRGRTPWLGDEANPILIDEYAMELDSFLKAMKDGVITKKEVHDQEKHVASMMAEIEPLLWDELHEKITTLLVTLSAFNVMQTINTLQELRPSQSFIG